ncbi:MAG TPA: hypothetical protein VKB85_10405, partial [Propionibacteriaceae bacterium]|nr:hypothetical protein [Propionibacteriaceae bacterium]
VPPSYPPLPSGVQLAPTIQDEWHHGELWEDFAGGAHDFIADTAGRHYCIVTLAQFPPSMPNRDGVR